jgi:hypothetical protein
MRRRRRGRRSVRRRCARRCGHRRRGWCGRVRCRRRRRWRMRRRGSRRCGRMRRRRRRRSGWRGRMRPAGRRCRGRRRSAGARRGRRRGRRSAGSRGHRRSCVVSRDWIGNLRHLCIGQEAMCLLLRGRGGHAGAGVCGRDSGIEHSAIQHLEILRIGRERLPGQRPAGPVEPVERLEGLVHRMVLRARGRRLAGERNRRALAVRDSCGRIPRLVALSIHCMLIAMMGLLDARHAVGGSLGIGVQRRSARGPRRHAGVRRGRSPLRRQRGAARVPATGRRAAGSRRRMRRRRRGSACGSAGAGAARRGRRWRGGAADGSAAGATRGAAGAPLCEHR